MANHTITIEMNAEEKHLGVKFKSVRWDIVEHGHPDRGDFV